MTVTTITKRHHCRRYVSDVNLTIYVEEGCSGCQRARRLAVDAARRYPALDVGIVDIGAPGVTVPDDVFAVPTYKLNGRVISLGNPTTEGLNLELEDAFAKIEGQ